LHPPGVLRGKCACSFLPQRSAPPQVEQYAARSSSSGAGSVHCGAHVDAYYRTNRGREKNDGYVPSEAANRQLLAGRSRTRRGRRSSRSIRGAPRTRGRPDCPNRAGAEGPSPGSTAANMRTGTADSPAVSASGNELASTSTASAVLGARGLRAPSKRTRAVVRTAPRYGSYAAAGYQPWYGAKERGSYGLQSRYGAYGNPEYQ